MVDPKECLFCRIVKGEIPSKKVYEDTNTFAFLDINPRNPGHTLIITKKHFETLFDMPDAEGSKLFLSMRKVANLVKNGTKAHGLSVCQNNGSAAGQVVAHIHFHLIPRFLNEGPAAVEAMLPVKKMDDNTLDKIAATIKGASSAPAKVEDEHKEQKPVEKKPAKTKAKKEEPAEEEDVDEFEEIDFNF